MTSKAILPSTAWMIKNGLRGLVIAMSRDPDKFAHIPREFESNPVREWLAIAKDKAKDDGVCYISLAEKKKYRGLIRCVRLYPDIFKDIKIEIEMKHVRSPQEWAAFAKEMARDNGGKLPCISILKKNCSGLAQAIHKRPELFKGIQCDKKVRSPEEWVAEAKNLAEQNGGFLPALDRKHCALAHWLRTRPELFRGIKRQQYRRSPQEWAAFAKEMARDNGGKLPRISILKKNYSCSGLPQVMREHPELFRGIQQERWVGPEGDGSTGPEHVEFAMKTAKENGGVLPRFCVLRKQSRRGRRLVSYILANPNMFSHIKCASWDDR